MIGCRIFLFTNNPTYAQLPLASDVLTLVDGSALDVCLRARDRIHLGAVLLHHPLYGNFQPRHQPFRTLLLSEGQSPAADAFSLRFIEEALRLFAKDAPLLPEDVPAIMRRDCALLDFELMRRTLSQSGLIEAEIAAPICGEAKQSS